MQFNPENEHLKCLEVLVQTVAANATVYRMHSIHKGRTVYTDSSLVLVLPRHALLLLCALICTVNKFLSIIVKFCSTWCCITV